jgi:hypothetical protein
MHPPQASLAATQRLQGPFAIGHFSGGERHRVRQTLAIDCNVALDTRGLLACAEALERRRIRVLDALRVNNQQCRAGAAPQLFSGRASLVFLKPAPKR